MNESELVHLLAVWAARHQLGEREVSQLRARVLETAGADAAESFDPEWLWRFLRPLTALLDGLDDEPPSRPNAWATYLQLA